jgi:hypothetical protein
MRITDPMIDSGSLTGRSGINLDEFGYIENDSSLIFWVLDGVSPLIFRRKDVWQFRKFFRAGDLLNRVFKCASWNDVRQTFSNISRQIRQDADSAIFLSDSFYHWPLFSCGLVKVSKKNERLELALYGDCVIVIQRGDSFEKHEYLEIENRKSNINKIFDFFDLCLNASVSGYFKKVLFAFIRVQQIWLGKYRVFSIKKHYPPSITKMFENDGIDSIAILSDGVSWYIKNNEDHMGKLMSKLSENGVSNTLSWLRSMENMNTDFGKYDDATIFLVKL